MIFLIAVRNTTGIYVYKETIGDVGVKFLESLY